MIRALCLIGGLSGAAGLSQAPEFTQQYLQRLAGQVDALTMVAKEFDAAALAAGKGREEALEEIAGSAFLAAHQADMRAMFARHARLSADLAILRGATPLERLTMPHRLADTQTLRAVWADYTPAMPISSAGAAAAGAGFLAGWAVFAAFLSALALPLRRKPAAQPAAPAKRRVDPPRLTSPVPPQPQAVPRLAGVRR